jgi:glycosyltransferase involved in cell wall biosynthesis
MSKTNETGGVKPFRVLHIITRMIVGGAQENTLLSVEGLDRLPDFEVTLVSGTDKGSEGTLLPRAQQTTRLILVPELGRRINALSDLTALVKLYRLIKRGRYHIVHTHSSKASILGCTAAKLVGTPIVLETLHGNVFHAFQYPLINLLWKTIYRFNSLVTDHYVSVANAVSREAIEAGIGKAAKFTTIYSGMELDWFLHAQVDARAVRKEFGLPDDALVIGKIARLFPLKGHDQLLEIAQRVVARQPNVRFFLIGDGILKDSLRERLRRLGLEDYFVFAGLIPRERIPEMLAAMDVVVHTSLREGLARVLTQALAMGKPCVSLNISGAAEVVIHNETGFIVEPGDNDGLTEALLTLLADAELRARMSKAGRKHVQLVFRAETMVEELAELYRTLIQRYQSRLARW